MKVLRIVDWGRHFENNRTRELKRMDWVPVPNKHDGDGFTELLDHRDGVLHYGAWHLILQVASKCVPRGTLLRDGAGGSKVPHTSASIARLTRAPEKAFDAVIPRLVSIGWVEYYDDPAPSCGETAPRCVQVTMEGNGTEGNGTEQNRPPLPPAVAEGFERFWKAYPRKIGKGAAIKAWKRAKLPDLESILLAVEQQARSEQWTKDGGQFIPHAATWINQTRWLDEAPARHVDADTRRREHRNAHGFSISQAIAEEQNVGIEPPRSGRLE